MSNKLPYYAEKAALGTWAVFERHGNYVKLIIYCSSEKQARDTAYKWNGEFFKQKQR